MRRILIIITLLGVLLNVGCSNQDKAEEAAKDTNGNQPTIILNEKEVAEKKDVYGVGERVQVREDYAVTLVGVSEINDEDISYDNQTLLIEIMFENISIDHNHPVHKLESFQSNGFEINLNDGNPSIQDSMNRDFSQVVKYTPVGTRSLQKFVYHKESKEKRIEMKFPDYQGGSINFEVNVGETTSANLEGKMPKYSKTYRIGEPMILVRAKKDYTLTVDSVRKMDVHPEELKIGDMVLYEVLMSYSVPSRDKVRYVYDNLIVIDEKGNTGYPVYLKKEGYPLEIEDGFQISAYVATHTDNDKLILYYTQDHQVQKEGYFIEVNAIE